ncbi:MAG: hypothetical protein LC791_03730 [Acidobacteria bacterium]|nr:hypothetical protein [Acidobacteriota bacterium]
MTVDPAACARGAMVGAGLWLALGVTCTLVAADVRTMGMGLFPSPWWLGVLAVGGATVSHVARSTPLPWTLAIAALVLPAAAWLSLPPWPSLHAWSGPAGLIVVVLAAATMVWPRAARTDSGAGRWAPCLAAATAGLWLGSLWFLLRERGVGGDEPHYLLIAQSLLGDGDLDLRNNYDARDYLPYFGGSLEPRHVSLGVLGQEYSFHGPATAWLVLPAFAAGGPAAARLFIALVMAASSGLLWSAVWQLTHSGTSAWVAWAALIVCAPLGLNAALIYPDALGAAVTALALWALVRTERTDPPSSATLAAVGGALGLTPWLHLRLSVIAGCLGAGLLVALWRHPRRAPRIAALLVGPTMAAVGLFASTWWMFGTLDPTAAFRTKAAGSIAALPTGLVGLLADQEYGLLPWAPYFAAAALAVATIWRSSPALSASAVTAVGGTLMLAASFVWWGGQSAPARFLVPVLPLLAFGVGAAWHGSGAITRAFIGVPIVLAASLTVLAAVADGGAYTVNDPDGRGTLFEWMSPSLDLSTALPSLFREGATLSSEATVAGIWAVAVASAIEQVTAPAAWRVAAAALLVVLTLTPALVWQWRGISPWTPDRAQMALLTAAGHSRRPTALAMPGPRLVSRQRLVSQLSIGLASARPPAALLHVPMAPAGRYRIEVVPRTEGLTTSHRLTLALGRNAWPWAEWDATTGAPPIFTLAMPVWAIRVTTDDPTRPDAPAVRLRPLDVQPDPTGDGELAWTVTPYGDVVVYSIDLGSYPERGGLWLAGDRTVALAVSDREGGSRAARLHLEAGSAPVTVAISDDEGWQSVQALAPRARGQIDAPGHATGTPRPIRFGIRGGFAAADGRWLGVWVSVE